MNSTPSARVLFLLDKAKRLPELEQRKVSAILGACVADAAARPLHWVYDMSNLRKYLNEKVGNTEEERLVDRNQFPEFFPESRSPFYNIPTGQNSCYFDIAKSVLGSLSKTSGAFNYDAICADLKEDFFVKTDYDVKKRQEYMSRRARGLDLSPLQGKWISGSLIEFLQNFSAEKKPYGGPKIKETDGFCASMPLVALNAGQPELHEKVEDVVKTLSTWPTAVSHGRVAAKILEKFILGKESQPVQSVKNEIQTEFPDVYQSLEEVEEHLDQDHVQAVGWVFGRPCYNPGSFQGALHAILTSSSYSEAVRKTIRAGGCCCSRSFFIGSCAGALYGLDGIPLDWIARTEAAETILETSLRIITKSDI